MSVKMKSSAEDWQEYFDPSAYLNMYYGGQGRFMGDYWSELAERMHRIMETGITVHITS